MYTHAFFFKPTCYTTSFLWHYKNSWNTDKERKRSVDMRIREKGGNLLQRVNVNFLETETCSISWSPWSLYNCVHVKSHWNDTSIISFQRNWGTEQMSTTAFHICLTQLKIQLPWEHNLFFFLSFSRRLVHTSVLEAPSAFLKASGK